MKRTENVPSDVTRAAIKSAARKLFSERGIDGVSTREILIEAGQRNMGGLHYHFGSVDNLVKELIVDGAKPLDERRIAALDRLESGDEPIRLRDVVEVLVRPLADVGADEQGYLKFLTALNFGHRREFLEAIEGRWNVGWQRCLTHLRRMLPHIPRPILSQRFLYVELVVGPIMANREYFLESGDASVRLWRARHTVDNLIDFAQGALEAPLSAETATLLAPGSGSTRA